LVHRENRRIRRQIPTRTAGLKRPFQKSLAAFVGAGLLLMARKWSFAGLGFGDLILLPFLAALCVCPVISWYLRRAGWVPLGEVFCLLHLSYYLLPCLKVRNDPLTYAESEQTTALLAVIVFLGSFLAVYNVFIYRQRNGTRQMPRWLLRTLFPGAIWALFVIWLVWCLVLHTQWLPNFGDALNILRSLAAALATLSVLHLSFKIGRREISTRQSWLAFGGFSLGLGLELTSGYLNGPAQLLAVGILGFVLGRKQVPVIAIVLSITLLTILQLGKGDYRNSYWRGRGAESGGSVFDRYSVWLGAGWRNLTGGDSSIEGETRASLTDRASLLPVLATAIKVTPTEKPFLTGQTYLMTPQLLVPRILWSGKPLGNAPTTLLGIYSGIQTVDGAKTTSIAVGPIVEAWLNFGWIGLVVAGAFFGALYGLPARFSKLLVPTQVGWLVAAIFLVNCANLENSTPEMICSLFTSLVAGLVLLALVSRDPPTVPTEASR
jgi:hypothetical protein